MSNIAHYISALLMTASVKTILLYISGTKRRKNESAKKSRFGLGTNENFSILASTGEIKFDNKTKQLIK